MTELPSLLDKLSHSLTCGYKDLPISPPAAITPPKMSPKASSWEVSGTAKGVMPGGGAELGSWGSTITWDTDEVWSIGRKHKGVL